MDCAARATSGGRASGRWETSIIRRSIREMVDNIPQEVHGGGVGPLEVVDDDQQWSPLHAPLDQRARGEGDLALELLGLDVAAPALFHPEE